MHYPWPMHGEMGLVLSEAIDSVKNLLHNDMFPNYIKETLEKYIATSDVENNEHEYFSNQKDDEISDDSSNDCENDDNPPSSFFMEEETTSTNYEIDYTALQNSVNNNINEHGIISNLPLKTYLGYKKFISNALTIHMDNYKLNNTAPDDQLFNFSAIVNKHSEEVFEEMISNLRPLQLKAYNIVKNYITDNTKQLGLFLTGEGGTGKSKVIEAFFNFTRKYYGKTDELYGPIIVTAPTGTSSNNINGFTYLSVCCFTRSIKSPTEQTYQRMGKRISGAKIIVIDEISLTSLEDFYKQHIAYSRALSTLTDCQIEKHECWILLSVYYMLY